MPCDTLVVKLYRRIRIGVHPEVELLEALHGSPLVPGLHGRLDLAGATLLVVIGLVDGAPVAWEPLISRLAAGDDAVGEPGRLAAVVADLHRRLDAALGSMRCTAGDADAAHARARASLDGAAGSSDVVAELQRPLAERLAALARLEGAPLHRIHGDLHVGQFLRTRDGYVVVDWEGDPDRPLDERRRPDSPLRDLASLLLSFDHAACAAARRAAHFDWRAWAASARAEALLAYEASAGPIDRQLLRALEIDKEVAELAYATRFVPEWLYAPHAVLPTLVHE
jgi:maltokinase